jgi:cytochrome c-type biogenesis protein CcsB
MTLAEWSNLFVYAAMAVYALAFISFAVSFAATRRVDDPAAAPELVPVEVLAGAPVEAAAPGSPADDAARARAEARLRSPQVEAEMAAQARRGRGPGRRDASKDPDPGDLAPGRRAGNIAMSLTWLALFLLLAAVVTRALWAGRAPWGNMFEYSLASALAITGVFLAVSLRRDVRWLGLLVTAASLLTLGVAVLLLYNDSPQLVPALQSYWLVIHVAAAIIAGGAFTVGAAATVLYLAADRAERDAAGASHRTYRGVLAGLRRTLHGGTGRVAAVVAQRLPDPRTLDTLAYRVNAFVFPLWTFAVVSGAIWAEEAWGRYWGWDPKETWAFITWLAYAGYLHARATAGWRGRRAAVLALIAFACFLINFFGVNLFAEGLHSYAGV